MAASLVRTRIAAVAVATAVLSAVLVATPARAVLTGATSTTTTTVSAGATTALAGMSVTADASEDLSVTASTSIGTLTVDTTTGIALAYGYTATGAEVSFTGTGTQVSAALASIQLTVPAAAKGSSATVALVAQGGTSIAVYSADTGHYYEYVASPGISWSGARTAAQGRTFAGQSGYLATVPSAAVNSLITNKIPGALNVWIGGQAIANFGGYARSWQWMDGPLAGTEFTRCSDAGGSCDYVDSAAFYQNWASGEPNNWSNSEESVVTNWGAANGLWNDLADVTASTAGYVVEYGDLVYGSTGFAGTYSDSSSVAIVGVPDPPTGVSATAGLGEAVVSFTAPSNDGGSAIDGYLVTVTPGGATTACATSPCTVSGLTGAQTYTFGVQAHNAYGYSTTASSSATTIGLAPSAPTGFSSTAVVGAGYTDVVVSSGYPSPTYAVSGGALPDGLALDPTTGAITGTPLTSGAWSATIAATNTYGSATSAFSGTTEVAPTILTTDLGTLTWGVPVDWYLGVDGIPAAALSVASGALPSGLVLDADGRLHGTPDAVGTYTVSVAATNTHGTDNRAFSGTVAMATAPAPTIAGITSGDGILSVAFVPPASSGGGTILTYWYSIDGGATWLPRSSGTDESPLTIVGLTNGTTYEVMVLAVNGAGSGVPSNLMTGRAGSGTLSATGLGIGAVRLSLLLVCAGLSLVMLARRLRRSWGTPSP